MLIEVKFKTDIVVFGLQCEMEAKLTYSKHRDPLRRFQKAARNVQLGVRVTNQFTMFISGTVCK